MDGLDLEKLEKTVRKSLAEGLGSTAKGIPPFGASEEADSEERRRRDRETQELADRLAREEENHRQQDKQRADRLHKNLKATLGI